METIRIRLNEEQLEKLKRIAERDGRSITGVVKNYIECDNMPEWAESLFGRDKHAKEK